MSDFCGKIIPPAQGTYTGAYLHEYATSALMEDFDKIQNAPTNIIAKFVSFQQLEEAPLVSLYQLAKIIKGKKGQPLKRTLFIKLEPWSRKGQGRADQSYSLQDIVNKKYDHLLVRFAQTAQRLGIPIFVTFGHEMNGHWYPWSGNPALYKQAYRHVYEVVSRHTCNITWVFNPDKESSAQAYFPGKDCVDWIAVDGYNDTGNKNISHIFSNLAYLKTLGKPLMIGEFGCGKDNPQCLENYVKFIVANPFIKGTVYFNQNKEEAWAIDQPAETSAYKKAISSHGEYFRNHLQIQPKAKPARRPIPFSQLPKEIRSEWRKPKRGGGLAPKLDAKEIESLLLEDKLNFDAVGRIIQAIADNVEKNAETSFNLNILKKDDDKFAKIFPELKVVAEVDRRYGYQFLVYLTDDLEFWNNALTLLSVYAQRCIELDNPDKIEDALRWVTKIRKVLSNKLAVQKAKKARGEYIPALLPNRAWKRALPSEYALAVLMTTEAELRAQQKVQDKKLYEEGIALTVNALQSFLDVEKRTLYPSKPDYFSIAKAITVLADLYQQLGHLTTNLAMKKDYFKKAQSLYKNISALQDGKNGRGLDILIRERAGGKEVKLKISASPQTIEDAFNFNMREGYITPANKELASKGIYLYLKGTALIKQIGLFAAWPKIKPPKEVLAHLSMLQEGRKLIARMKKEIFGKKIIEIQKRHRILDARAWAMIDQEDRKLLKQHSFIDNLCKMIEAELLLMLADRAKFYATREDTDFAFAAKFGMIIDPASKKKVWQEAVAYAQKISPRFRKKPYFALLGKLGTAKFNDRMQLAEDFIVAAARYLEDIPKNKTYLYAWSKVKQLEIMIRRAEYFYPVKGAKLGDSRREINFANAIESLLHDISKDKPIAEYFKISYDYLRTIILLIGAAAKNEKGKYILEVIKGIGTEKKQWKRTVYMDDTLALIQQIEKDIQDLPPAARTYFAVYTALKEVTCLLVARKRKSFENKIILERIKSKTGDPIPQKAGDQETYILSYALELLEEIEGQVAPTLPSYTWYTLTVDLQQAVRNGSAAEIAKFRQPVEKMIQHNIERAKTNVLTASMRHSRDPNKKNQDMVDKQSRLLRLNMEVLSAYDKFKRASNMTNLQAFIRKLEILDASRRIDKNYALETVWPIHSLYAELYHQKALFYKVLERKKKNTGFLKEQYAQSAHMESALSTAPYDNKHRCYYIALGQIAWPNTDIPILKNSPCKQKILKSLQVYEDINYDITIEE